MVECYPDKVEILVQIQEGSYLKGGMMFIIKLYANELLIEEIKVVNTGEVTKYGDYQYMIRNVPEGFTKSQYIWHKPDNGAAELARLVLNRLKGIDT